MSTKTPSPPKAPSVGAPHRAAEEARKVAYRKATASYRANLEAAKVAAREAASPASDETAATAEEGTGGT